jgi:hypothetical protein
VFSWFTVRDGLPPQSVAPPSPDTCQQQTDEVWTIFSNNPETAYQDVQDAVSSLRRTPAEALAEPFAAFPSWFLRIICDRCGQQRMFSETHSAQRDMLIRDILYRMRHDGCGGRPGRVELLTGIEGASSRPVRRIVLIGG